MYIEELLFDIFCIDLTPIWPFLHRPKLILPFCTLNHLKSDFRKSLS